MVTVWQRQLLLALLSGGTQHDLVTVSLCPHSATTATLSPSLPTTFSSPPNLYWQINFMHLWDELQ